MDKNVELEGLKMCLFTQITLSFVVEINRNHRRQRGSEEVCVRFQLGEVCIALVSTIDEDKPFQIDRCGQSVYSCYLKLREVPSGILVLNTKCIRTTSFPYRKRSGSYCGSLEKMVVLSNMEVLYTDNNKHYHSTTGSKPFKSRMIS